MTLFDEPKLKNATWLWLAVAALMALAPDRADAQSAAVENQSSQPTNQPAWLNQREAVELSWGAFDFHPRLRESVVYDDNILFATRNKQQALVSQLAPGVQIVGGDRSSLRSYEAWYEERNQSFELTRLTPSWLVLQPVESWPGKFLLLDYSPRWQKFSRHSANDSLDQFLTFNGVWPMAKLVVAVRQDYRDEKTIVTEALTRSEVKQIHTELDAGYRLNEKFAVDTALERQDVSYPGSTNLNGYVEWKGTVSLNRQIHELFHAGLFVAGGVDQVGAGLDQSFERLGIRVRYDYSRMISVDGSVGVEDRQFDSGRANTFSPFFTLGAEYHPWERTYFRLGISRQQAASLNHGYFYTSTGGYLTLRKDFTDRFSLQTDLGYYQTDYTPIQNIANTSKPSDYYSLQLKGKVKLLKYLDAEAYYLFRGAGLSQNNNVLQDNQCGLQLAFHY
jgi:hypothetical protein